MRSIGSTDALDASGARSGGFAGLPTRAYFKAANQTTPLSTEVEISDELSQELSRGAFIPLTGRTGADIAMIPILVNTHRTGPGKLTVKGSLCYQMMAGRLAQLCAFLMDEQPAGDGPRVPQAGAHELPGTARGQGARQGRESRAGSGKDPKATRSSSLRSRSSRKPGSRAWVQLRLPAPAEIGSLNSGCYHQADPADFGRARS
jgi:hypothetical protein